MDQSKLKEFLDSSPSIQEIRKFAKMLGLRIKRTMKKRDLLKLLKKELETLEITSSVTSSQHNGEERLHPSLPMDFDLPSSYGKDRLVLLPVNPRWIHAYWDFSSNSRQKLLASEAILRLYDVTNIVFDGNNAHRIKEMRISACEGNWYFEVDFSDADYLAEIGYYESGKFFPLFRSNLVRTPSDHPKFTEREKWIDLSTRKAKVIVVGNGEKHFSEKNIGTLTTSFMNPSSEEFVKYLETHMSGGAMHE